VRRCPPDAGTQLARHRDSPNRVVRIRAPRGPASSVLHLSCLCWYASVRAMESASLAGLAIRGTESLDPPRHSLLVRTTHWAVTLAFFGLLVSGVAILVAHPRLYWGETGAVGVPSLIDLPLPFVIVGQTGWGRHLHFLSAWICVLAGIVYVFAGLYTGHFREGLLPAARDLAWNSLARDARAHVRLSRRSKQESGDDQLSDYDVLQRLAYLTVVFVLFPLAIWTGLAMSPAITSVFPLAVTIFGGQQSARTIHFFVACFLVLFLVVHVAMVCLSGFTSRMRSMITGRAASRTKPA
jgi:thiosulfate reductase cytochrome b subunit